MGYLSYRGIDPQMSTPMEIGLCLESYCRPVKLSSKVIRIAWVYKSYGSIDRMNLCVVWVYGTYESTGWPIKIIQYKLK